MVSRVQLDRLGARIEELAELLDPDSASISVAVFRGETPEFAAQRHCELRPEHAGRGRVRFDYRPNQRNELHELGAVWAGATKQDLQALMNFIGQAAGGPRNFLGEEYESADVEAALGAEQSF